MRTTIRIDDELYRHLKATAARTGRTVAAVIEDAIRLGLVPSEEPRAARYAVRPIGSGGLKAGVDLSFNSAVIDAMDEGSSSDALR